MGHVYDERALKSTALRSSIAVNMSVHSGTTIQNQVLIGGKQVKMVTQSNNGQTQSTLDVQLQPNFGTCGWSGSSGNNPIPFILNDQQLSITTSPASDWIRNCSISKNTIAYKSSAIDSNTHVHLFPNMYADFQCPISYSNNVITLQANPPYPMQSKVTKFRLKNTKQLTPNSYYFDYSANQIVVLLNGPAQDIYISDGSCIADLTNVSNVKFDGVTFAGGHNGVNISGCDNISFTNCKFMHIPQLAMYVTKSTNVTIDNCTFEDCGRGAINFVSCGNYTDLSSANISITNSTFRDCNSMVYSNASYINSSLGVGFNIQNCAFYNSTGAAINLKSNDTTISQCYFENCCQYCSDYGVIYEGRTLTRRGLTISDCYFKTVASNAGSPKHTIYCDDGYSGAKIINCLFEDITFPNTCFFSFGRDHTIENCTTVNSATAFQSGPPRMPSGVAVPEYNSLMSNQAQKALFVRKYPELSVPIDFSGGHLHPKLTVRSCNLTFDNPAGKTSSGSIRFANAPESTMSGIKVIAKDYKLPDGTFCKKYSSMHSA